MTNPFLGPEFQGGRQGQKRNPFLSEEFGFEEEDLTTATGRKREELTNIATNREKLKAIRAKASPVQQARIDKILAEMDKGGEDQARTGRRRAGFGPIEDFVRGATAGVANAIPSVGDLALTPLDLLGNDAAASARRSIQERKQVVREAVEPKGAAGTVGEFVGEVAGSAIPYGTAAGATGKVAAKLIPGLAKRIAAGKVSTEVAKRIIANVGENVIGGSIINALQAAGLPDADIKEKLKTFGIGLGADILFGTAQGLGVPSKAAAGKKPTPTPEEVDKDTKALADKLQAEGKKRLVQKEAESQIRKLAKADWQLRNPTGNWAELTKAQREEIYKAARVKLEAEGALKKEGDQLDLDLGRKPRGENQEVDVSGKMKQLSEMTGSLVLEIEGILGRRLTQDETRAVSSALDEAEISLSSDSRDILKVRSALIDKFKGPEGTGGTPAVKPPPAPVSPTAEAAPTATKPPTAEQLRNLLTAGSEDDPIIKQIRARKDIGSVEKQLKINEYRKQVKGYQDNLDKTNPGWREAAGAKAKPTKPVSPIDAKLQELKARAAETPVEPPASMTLDEAAKGFDRYGEGGKEGIKNWAQRLGRLAAELRQHKLEAEINEVQPGPFQGRDLKEAERVIEKAIKDIKSGAIYDDMTEVDIENLLKEAKGRKPEAIIKEKEEAGKIADLERNVVQFYGQDESSYYRNKLKELSQRTGESEEAILARLKQKAIDFVDKEIKDAKNYLRQSSTKENQATWKKALDDAVKKRAKLTGESVPNAEQDWTSTLNKLRQQDMPDHEMVNWLMENKGLSGPEADKAVDDYISKHGSSEDVGGVSDKPFDWSGASEHPVFTWLDRYGDSFDKKGMIEKLQEQFNIDYNDAEIFWRYWSDTVGGRLDTPEARSRLPQLPPDSFSGELDVGRTVFEPDAARRRELAHPTVPKDISDSFTDLIIDAVKANQDEGLFVKKLIQFARENELPDEAVFNSLEEATGWKPKQDAEGNWTIEGSKLTSFKEGKRPIGGHSPPPGYPQKYYDIDEIAGNKPFPFFKTIPGDQGIGRPLAEGEVLPVAPGERYPQPLTAEMLEGLNMAANLLDSVDPTAAMRIRNRIAYEMSKGDPRAPIVPMESEVAPEPKDKKGKGKVKVVPGEISKADLSALTPDEIDRLKDRIFDALDADPDNELLMADLNKLAAATRALPKEVPVDVPPQPVDVPLEESAMELPPLPEDIPPEIAAEIEAQAGQTPTEQVPFAGKVRPEYVQEPLVQGKAKPQETPFMDPLEYAKLARTSPRKLSDEQLQQMIDETDLRLRAEQSPEYKQLMDKLMAERAARRPPPLQANFPRQLGGAGLGYIYGLSTGDEENRQSNALMWAAAGGLGAHYLGKALNKGKPPKKELFPGQNKLPKVISYEDERGPKTLNPMANARRIYAGLVRSTAGLESIYQKTNSSEALPTHRNAAKMASIFGRWIAVAERWMTNRPVILGPDGEPKYLDAPSLKEVGDIVGGDIENLDEVAVALTTLENVGKIKSLPMDPVRAHLIVSNATPELIQGARAMRKYALALADAMVDAGILSPEVRDKFGMEQWYTPLQRVFGDGVTKQQIEQMAKLGDVAVSPNPVKGRKGGSKMEVKSPFETLQRMTAQYVRAAEYNKIKQQFVAFAKAHPDLDLIQRVDAKKNPVIDTFQTQIQAIKKLIPSIDNESASRLALALGEEIDPRSPIMTIYEDGVLRSYRIHEPVFDAFKAMLPSEMSTALKLFAVPTQLATRGVVHNPFFIGQQFFVDTFQAALMSKYGFRPGIDSVRGWWNAITRSPEYQRILDLGGPATIQSLPYINPKVSSSAIKTAGGSLLETAAKQLKELHPIEAYKTLVTPVAEAARIGEALRALDHGESTISAVYNAWHVTGNTKMQGHFGAIRAFNQLSMFSRPAISAMDEALTKAGVNPFRRPDRSNSTFGQAMRNLGFENDRVINGAEFMTKGFALIGLPSLYLWFHNKGDEEIEQLRQTQTGQRYWFFRGPEQEGGQPGQIYKVRKPHVLGQMFGSTLEETLDQMYDRDPENTVRWVGGLVNDVALNMLPQFGVVPAALWGNKIPGLDIPIVPESDMKLEPQLMGAPQASNPARILSDHMSPISNALPQGAETLRRALSPAGMDFVFNSIAGMMGQDATQAIDAAINYYDAGLAPAAHEWPMVGRIFGRYPSMNTRNVRDFYKKANDVETAALTFDEYLKTNPEQAVEYFITHQKEISLAQAFQSTRQDVVNLRRVVEELKEMLRNKQISQSEFRRVEEEMLRQIILKTGLTNSVANQIMVQRP